MALHVDASSLSDITQLASNPPKYPRNPTERKREPLTLYIARVPGSRDIILTTLKPQLKSVTAGDVSNSLYYLHLNTEEDAQLLATEDENFLEKDEPIDVLQKPLPFPQRKPLPDSARSSIELNRQPLAIPDPLSISGSNQKIGRKPLATEWEKAALSNLNVDGMAQKRPLGPRPLFSESSIGSKPLPAADNGPLSSGSASPVQGAPHSGAKVSHGPNSSDFSSSPASSASNKAFSITLIRRDVSSGAQWNVGTVIGERLDDEPHSPSSKKAYLDLSVHLVAPGYTKFRDRQLGSRPATGHAEVASMHLHDEVSAASVPSFDRQVRMEGASFWERPKQKRAQSDIPRSITGGFGSPDSDGSFTDNNTRDSGAKGYVFTSPWGGRCKFSTSVSGRSLRCKHKLAGPVSATKLTNSPSSSQAAVDVSELRFNLPASAMAQSPPTSPHLMGSPRLMGSPLLFGRESEHKRFHIPKFSHMRSKLSPDKTSKPALPPRPHATSYAAMYPSDDERPPLPRRPYSNYNTESSDESAEEPPSIPNQVHPFPYVPKSQSNGEEGRLDLSLGQERAGGGSKGKGVKLGKLIIMDEGTKMLDLIVAANMGVWWSIWESSA